MIGMAERPHEHVEGASPTLRGHWAIMRVDHWAKNVFVLPGVVVAVALDRDGGLAVGAAEIILGLLATGLIASSNYVINEVLDAPQDRHHPVKRNRPVPAGQVSIPLAYVQWLVLMAAGLAVAALVRWPLVIVLAGLWLMGCVYNIRPVRSKDLPYIDVLSESINNPLRLLAGWYMVRSSGIVPGSLIMSYWMVGAYFMGIKRFAEYRRIGGASAPDYRRSFRYYTPGRLLNSVVFYGMAAMLFFGAFIILYRLEMILSFPLVAVVMAVYFSLGFQDDSPVQRPESLYRQAPLMVAVVICVAVMVLLLYVDIPALYDWVAPGYHWQALPASAR